MNERAHERSWEPLALLVLAAAGLAIAAYLTATHANAVPLVCSVGSVVDCASVTHSAYSVIPGTTVPIAVPGIVWFLVSGLLALIAMQAARSGHPEPGWLRRFDLIWAGLALAVVLYLVYIEIVVLHRICEWCTVIHLLVLATFVLALRRLQQEKG